MLSFLTQFRFDLISFWIGFICALIIWWVVVRLRKFWPQVTDSYKERVKASAQRSRTGIKDRINRETLERVQNIHLASALFSLDEIVVPPRFLPPILQVDPADPSPFEDPIHTIIPYLPDWPELASQFRLPSLGMIDVLKCNVNLAIIGQPGCGKTIALSYLASQLARSDPSLEGLSEQTPIYLHVNDLDYSTDYETAPFDVILTAELSYMPGHLASQVSRFLQRSAINGQIMLILDGVDELPSNQLKGLSQFLNTLLKGLPELRIVLAASPEYMDGLVGLGFYPLSLATWNHLQRIKFIKRWGALWTQVVEPILISSGNTRTISSDFIVSWLSDQDAFLNPLELTLKLWAAFLGDTFGTTNVDSLDSYFRRQISNIKIIPLLEKLALEMLKARQMALSPEQVETIFSGSEWKANSLLGSGLIVRHGNRFSFTHPVLMGYLAGQSVKEAQLVEIVNQPAWVGKTLTLHYASACEDLTSQILPLLEADKDDPLYRNLFMVSRWLRDTQANVPWRSQVMWWLVEIIKHEALPLSMRSRGLAALLCTNDPSVIVVLRQMLVANHPTVRHLAAIGCGVLQDTKSMNDLAGMLNDENLGIRAAASLALISINFAASLDGFKDLIAHGDEKTGRIIAMLLAEQSSDGQAVLKTWCGDPNLLVRRASVFGLEQVRNQWADSILEKLSVEDGEWIVRNAAGQVLENRRKSDSRPLKVLSDPHNAPWLIAYASRQGTGISPNQPVTPLLLSVLESGNSEEQQAALDYLCMINEPDPGLIMAIYRVAYNQTGLIREIAFNAIWQLATTGVVMPSPVEFGMAPPLVSLR